MHSLSNIRTLASGMGLGLAVLLGAAALGGCAGNKVTSFTSDADIKARMDAAIAPGMPEAQVKSKLSSLGFNAKYQISRREPPGLLARAWPPGGFWVTQDIQTLRYLDVLCELDAQRKLVAWRTQRGEITYRFGEPVSPGQDPNRRFPLPPLPPEGWGGLR
jgi:hypothetical protein